MRTRIRPCMLVLTVIACTAAASPVGEHAARAAAESWLAMNGMDADCRIASSVAVTSGESPETLAWAFELEPTGYVVTGADDVLPAILAYSYSADLRIPGEASNPLLDLVRMDMGERMESLDRLSPETADRNRGAWVAALSGGSVRTAGTDFEQWPPVGSSPTEGWIEQNWTQTAPYNQLCPMDLLAGQRSVAGCPAVAMGMIVNFHASSNGTRFDDEDDYYHNYHEYYWIDDDHVAHDFPSWSELDAYLDAVDVRWQNQEPLTNVDKAAVVYACGAACRQVYTASVSGTFGVDQAYDAYLRFGFDDCELLFAESDSLYERMAENMMTARPAHLAIIDEGPQYGHNVVMDGYNTDGFFHLNFGWGGPYNGWYSFPLSGMPYGMNFVEGIVLDIGEPSQSAGEDPVPGGPAVGIRCLGNPCSGSARLALDLPAGCDLTLSVYALDGRLVDSTRLGELPPGPHEVTWDAGGSAPGVYVVVASHPGGVGTAMLTLLD